MLFREVFTISSPRSLHLPMSFASFVPPALFAGNNPLLLQATGVPDYVAPVMGILFVAGAAAAIVATALGFRRIAAFGASARWFALAALCLLLHLTQFAVTFVAAFVGANANNFAPAFALVAFFNLFVALAAVCLVMGFVRLTDAR